MRLLFFVLLQFFISMPLISYAVNMAGPAKKENIKENKVTESRKTSIAEAYGNLPLYFIENKGQVEKAVKFYEKGAGHATYFTEEGVVLSLSKREDTENDRSAPLNKTINLKKDKKITTESVSLSFIGANKGAKITSSTPLPGRVNYFVGNEKSEWQSNVSTYESVTYEDIYKNIDIKFYGNSKDIEHDVIVRPGGDFSKVIFAYRFY